MPKKPELSAADQALRESMGAAIRLACAKSGRKPTDVSIAGGISLAQQYRIEGGEATPDALYLVKVARYLGVTLDALVRPGSEHHAHTGSGNVTQGNNTGAGSVQVGISHGAITSPGQVPSRRGRPPKNP